MKRKTVRFRAIQEFPLWKGPWRNNDMEAREDASRHSPAAIVQMVELGSPIKITKV